MDVGHLNFGRKILSPAGKTKWSIPLFLVIYFPFKYLVHDITGDRFAPDLPGFPFLYLLEFSIDKTQDSKVLDII